MHKLEKLRNINNFSTNFDKISFLSASLSDAALSCTTDRSNFEKIIIN